MPHHVNGCTLDGPPSAFQTSIVSHISCDAMLPIPLTFDEKCFWESISIQIWLELSSPCTIQSQESFVYAFKGAYILP